MKKAFLALFIALIVLIQERSANAQSTVQIFAIKEDGTGLKELTKGYSAIGRVKFSPDGSKLVFGAVFGDAPRPHCGFIAGLPPLNRKLFLMNSDGSDLHEIHGYSSAFDPVFMRDGKKILFTQFDVSAGTCSDKLLGIYSMNLDGTGITLIVPDADNVNISSDGSKLVFGKAGAFFISNADGSDAKQLGGLHGPYVSKLTFNPTDSSEIMFIATATSTISTINISSLNRNVVLQGPNDRRRGLVMGLTGADYSPDGKTVAYSAKVPDTPPAITLYDHVQIGSDRSHFEIYEVSSDGTGGRQITDNALLKFPYDSTDPSSPAAYTQAYDPAYSPDGRTIIFVGRTGR